MPCQKRKTPRHRFSFTGVADRAVRVAGHRCGAHVLAALQAPHQVEAGVCKGLLQRVRHLKAHALREALLRSQRIRPLRLPHAPSTGVTLLLEAPP